MHVPYNYHARWTDRSIDSLHNKGIRNHKRVRSLRFLLYLAFTTTSITPEFVASAAFTKQLWSSVMWCTDRSSLSSGVGLNQSRQFCSGIENRGGRCPDGQSKL